MGLSQLGYNWGYKSPKWGYPNYNLLRTLLTKFHEPSSTVGVFQIGQGLGREYVIFKVGLGTLCSRIHSVIVILQASILPLEP